MIEAPFTQGHAYALGILHRKIWDDKEDPIFECALSLYAQHGLTDEHLVHIAAISRAVTNYRQSFAREFNVSGCIDNIVRFHGEKYNPNNYVLRRRTQEHRNGLRTFCVGSGVDAPFIVDVLDFGKASIERYDKNLYNFVESGNQGRFVFEDALVVSEKMSHPCDLGPHYIKNTMCDLFAARW